MSKGEDLTKLQIRMSKTALDELNALQAELRASTRTETVKASLKLMKYVQQRKNEGAKFIIKDKSGKEREIVI